MVAAVVLAFEAGADGVARFDFGAEFIEGCSITDVDLWLKIDLSVCFGKHSGDSPSDLIGLGRRQLRIER